MTQWNNIKYVAALIPWEREKTAWNKKLEPFYLQEDCEAYVHFLIFTHKFYLSEKMTSKIEKIETFFLSLLSQFICLLRSFIHSFIYSGCFIHITWKCKWCTHNNNKNEWLKLFYASIYMRKIPLTLAHLFFLCHQFSFRHNFVDFLAIFLNHI